MSAPGGASPALFTYRLYGDLLAELSGRGFGFALFGEAAAGRRAYLRHDLDLSLARALPIAEIEARAGARATYLVLLDTGLYNVATRQARAVLDALAGLGHDIGLHAVVEPDWGAERVDAYCRAAAGRLADAIGRPVGVFSFHRPPARLLAGEVSPDGLINCYAPSYFAPERYISDSNHNWRCGDPRSFIRAFEGEVLQVLTHPAWWTEAPTSAADKVRAALDEHDRAARSYLLENIGIAKEALV